MDNEWISVSRLLPSKKDWYLVKIARNNKIFVALGYFETFSRAKYWTDIKGNAICSNGNCNQQVVAWKKIKDASEEDLAEIA